MHSRGGYMVLDKGWGWGGVQVKVNYINETQVHDVLARLMKPGGPLKRQQCYPTHTHMHTRTHTPNPPLHSYLY